MFLRTVKVKRPGGRVDEYIRLVESVWREGRPEHRIVAHLGRKDLLAPHAATLLRMLTGDKASGSDAAHVDAVGAWDWGPVLVARHLWREQGMARWLETTYVCDRSGQRWWPAWRDEAERLASRRPRVRVKDRQLRQWYGTLDWLVRHKPQLEQELFGRLRTLFALNVDLVFYDLTSTYFEGNGPTGLAKHGHSRDGKPRNRQVLVGVVMIDGWPIAHHVFEGNRRDASTVKEVVSDLQARFGLRRVVFVGDRGMVTAPNVALLRAQEQGYVVGLNRRRRPKVLEYVRRATGPWLDCPLAISARERVAAPKTRVQEVHSDEPGVRVFVVHSEERLAYERGEREKGDAASADATRSARETRGRRQAARAGENRRGGRPDPRAHPWVPLLRLDPDEGEVSVCGAPGASRAREGARGDVSDPNRRAALITHRSGDGLQRTQRGRTRLCRAQRCDRDAAHLSPQGRPRARPHLCGLPRVSP